MRRLALALVLIAPTLAHADDEQRVAIRAGCLASTNWTEAACTCIAEAAQEMTLDQQTFLAISLRGDPDAAAPYVARMSAPEMLEASMFMMKSGPACQ